MTFTPLQIYAMQMFLAKGEAHYYGPWFLLSDPFDDQVSFLRVKAVLENPYNGILGELDKVGWDTKNWKPAVEKI